MKTAKRQIIATGEIVEDKSDGYRKVCRYELYTADYFGRGERQYLSKRFFSERLDTGNRVLFNVSDDGNQQRITAFRESHGI